MGISLIHPDEAQQLRCALEETEGLAEAAVTEDAERARPFLLRYIEELVIPLGLCPWAEPALRKGHVELACLDVHAQADEQATRRAEALAAKALLQARDAQLETELILLCFPRFRGNRAAFEAVLRELRALYKDSCPWVFAAFHPEASAHLETPSRLIPFLRRTPDPVIQALRSEVLRRVEPTRGTGTLFVSHENLAELLKRTETRESVRERILRQNHQTVLRLGVEEIEARFDRLVTERNQTMVPLGFPARLLPKEADSTGQAPK